MAGLEAFRPDCPYPRNSPRCKLPPRTVDWKLLIWGHLSGSNSTGLLSVKLPPYLRINAFFKSNKHREDLTFVYHTPYTPQPFRTQRHVSTTHQNWPGAFIQSMAKSCTSYLVLRAGYEPTQYRSEQHEMIFTCVSPNISARSFEPAAAFTLICPSQSLTLK